jgi:lipopolysaccharide export system protein LptC
MRGRNIPIMPLAILALLGGLMFWLSQYAATNAARNAGRDRHDPDVIIEQFTARKLSPAGDIQYVLTAKKMTHYADDDSAVFESVVFQSTSPGQPTLIARAPTGKSFEGGNRIELEGGVVVNSQGGSTADMTMTTPRATILPEENLARSDAGVVVDSAQGRLRAASFELNNETQIATFGRAQLALSPPKNRK